MKPSPVRRTSLLTGERCQRFGQSLDRPAIVLLDLVAHRPAVHPGDVAALDEEGLTREWAVGRGQVGDDWRDVGRVPHVERAFLRGDDLLEARRRKREASTRRGGNAVALHPVADELLRTDLTERRDA